MNESKKIKNLLRVKKKIFLIKYKVPFYQELEQTMEIQAYSQSEAISEFLKEQDAEIISVNEL
jgi:hypothetical protein